MTILEAAARAGQSMETVSTEVREAKLRERASDPNNAATAFAAFTVVTAKVATAQHAVAIANFGPIRISDSCDYDCNFREWSWWFEFHGRDLLPFPSTLVQMDCGTQFSQAFQSVRVLLASLVATKTSLTTTITTIKTIDKAIIQQGGTPTTQQLHDLNKAFETANAEVIASNRLNDDAIQAVSTFESNYKGYEGLLQSQAVSTQASFDGDITYWRNKLLGDAKCGTGTLTAKFQGVTNTINASIASLSPSFTVANTVFGTAMRSTSLVIGNLVAMQASYVAVQDALSAAKALDPTSVIRKIKLDIAGQTFADLEAYANTNLKT